MSGTGSATMPSSASTSSIVITCVSSEVTTSTRAPATSRRRSAEMSDTGAEPPSPLIVSSIPSRAAKTSMREPAACARARALASRRSIAASSWVGSWWKSATRLAPAAMATSTAYSTVEWPQPTRCRNSSSVYCASWMTRSAPFMNATWRWSPG